MRIASITFKITLGILIVVVTAWSLLWISQEQLTDHLRDRAAFQLSLATTDRSPHRWRFHSPRDIVAGKVFDSDHFDFRDRRLRVRSTGKPFQIGLPLASPLDLARFPRLYVVLGTRTDVNLRVLIRQRLHLPQYTSQIVAISSARHALTIDLDALRWRVAQNRATMPATAAMLRLQIDAPAGDIVELYETGLTRRGAGQLLDLDQPVRILQPGAQAPADALGIYRLPQTGTGQALRTIASSLKEGRVPIVLLPLHNRVEQQLILRNRIRTALPGSIVIPATALPKTLEQARTAVPGSTSQPVVWRWAVLAMWLACMSWVRWRPPANARLRAFLEISLVLGGMLWLIVGARFNGHIKLFQGALIAVTLLFALTLRPIHTWRWNGSVTTWLLALAVVVLAGVIGLLFHPQGAALRHISQTHLMRYLFWALLQQYLICTVCTERWRIVSGNCVVAAYLGALGFALLHTPNATLMLATLTGGILWCSLYLRDRALLPIAVSHAASAMLLLALLPRDLLYSAEVSARFFQ